MENYHGRVLRPQEIDSSSSRSYMSITIIVVSLAVLFKETTKNQVDVTLNCLVEMSLVVFSNSMEVLSSASSGGACWILLVTNKMRGRTIPRIHTISCKHGCLSTYLDNSLVVPRNHSHPRVTRRGGGLWLTPHQERQIPHDGRLRPHINTRELQLCRPTQIELRSKSHVVILHGSLPFSAATLPRYHHLQHHG